MPKPWARGTSRRRTWVTASIIQACYDAAIDPQRVVKLSGIGCSSKTTNYFLNQAFGINGIHGRMAAMATGSGLANRALLPIGVSGDGDTASIGLGNFMHMMRRNLRITYIVENIRSVSHGSEFVPAGIACWDIFIYSCFCL